MTKIDRHTGDLTPFAQNATAADRKVFGDVTESDTLDDNLNAFYKGGWADVTDPTLWPKLRDFNAAMFTAGQLIAYIIQRGVPEYHAEQEYFIGSMCSNNGQIYVSLADGNTNHLLTEPLFWQESLTIPDLSITHDKMANLSIGSNNLQVDSVYTNAILNHAVALQKLSLGTPWDIIGFDATGEASFFGAPLGVNQTWNAFTRIPGTTYTNFTNQSILLVINSKGNVDFSITVNGVLLATLLNDFHNERMLSVVVPVNHTYVFSGQYIHWNELR